MRPFVPLVLALHAALAPIAGAQTAAGGEELRGEALMRALHAGGYTILLRHARTDRSYQEEIGSIPAERSRQRNLSADGVRDAALMGAVLRRYQVPIGEIASSPMYRTRETAEYAAGTPTRIELALRTFPTTDQTAAIVAEAPKRGTNRLIVTHHFVIERHVPGIRPGDIGESEAAVVQPAGNGSVKLVGRILLADWERLAGVTPPAAASSTSAQAMVHAAASPSAAPSAAPSRGADSVAIPGTPAGRLARAYLDAFNANDESRIRAFIETHLVPNPDRPTEARFAAWRQSFATLGPLTVTNVQESTDAEIRLGIRAKAGDYFLILKVSPEHPGRAASISIGTTGGGHS